jgi:cytochrome c biogenesis protein CcdA
MRAEDTLTILISYALGAAVIFFLWDCFLRPDLTALIRRIRRRLRR